MTDETSKPANAVPFLDLKAQYASIRSEIDKAILDCVAEQDFIQGPKVARFEQDFASLIGAKSAAACSNGTSALSISLEALGIKAGDEVITTAHTFIATAEAICHVGATPRFVDISPETYLIDVNCIEAAITPRTKAIIAVHLYGTPCDMDAIGALAARHGLFVVEDAAQAHLASWRDRYAGTLGHCAAFSFYPGKNLGAYGDAGIVVCNDDNILRAVKKLRDHGRSEKYLHEIVGYNHRMDALQAVILSVKLKYLKGWTEARQTIADTYDKAFRAIGLKTAAIPQEAKSSRHLYIIEADERESLQRHLKDMGIATGVHYPIPLHQQPAFHTYRGDSLPVTERISHRILSLPIYPEMTPNQIEYVIHRIKLALKMT